MQWKQMDWPLMFDPLNQLGVDVVPITLLIDEHGIVRARNPSRDDVSAFVKVETGQDQEPAAKESVEPDVSEIRLRAGKAKTSDGLPADADAQVLWGNSNDLDSAISSYERFLATNPGDAAMQFRAGVAFRKRYDSDHREAGDFQAASEHWTRALELNPNQYIWRRRIQQYGPRLQKPYAFFDWVAGARAEIRARGEIPAALKVEPLGAELASPASTISGKVSREEPDPDGRVFRDHRGYVRSEYTVVPAVARPGQAVRVHVELTPDERLKARWNNEVEGVVLWVTTDGETIVDTPYQMLELPEVAVSTEARQIELEVEIPASASEKIELSAYALYYVCEDKTGTCLYRRLDVPISIPVQR